MESNDSSSKFFNLRTESLARWWVIPGALVAAVAFLQLPGLLDSRVSAFRDAYHFYYPQAVWLHERASSGSVFPTWNNSAGIGASVVAQTSSAVYYPLRWIWWLPFFTVAQRYAIFVVVHVLIAAWTIRYAASRLRVSPLAAWVGAIGYALSCPVYFQLHNLIYLTSAAWVGLAMAGLFDFSLIAKQKNGGSTARALLRGTFLLAISCSLMLLGGDPHCAANGLILAAVIVAILTLTRIGNTNFSYQPLHRKGGSSSVTYHRCREALQFLIVRLACLALCSLIVGLATCAQWVPALRASRNSQRFQGVSGEQKLIRPATISIAVASHQKLASLIETSRVPRSNTFDFSCSPWHLATLVWPTLGGDYAPDNGRIFSAIPSEGRMWVPSLYFGCVPLLFALLAVKNIWREPSVVLLATVTVTALLASFGDYSIGWLLKELMQLAGLENLTRNFPADRGTSLYGLLVDWIPGYAAFRYPAKWTVWFVAGASLLAALGLHRECESQRGRALSKRALKWLAVGSLIPTVIGCVALTYPAFNAWLFQSAVDDRWLGSFDGTQAARSLVLAGVVPFAGMLLLHSVGARPKWFVAFSLIEMTIVAASWTCFVARPEKLLDDIAELPERGSFVWADVSEADFADDLVPQDARALATLQAAYRCQFLLGKLAEVHGIRNLSATQSIEFSQVASLKRWLRAQDDLSKTQPELDKVLRAVGVTHRLIRFRQDHETKLRWLPIGGTSPMCELFDAQSMSQRAAATCNVRWLADGTCEIETPEQSFESLLLVRQFNDGGWSAAGSRDGVIFEELQLNTAPTLFLEIQLPVETRFVKLTRRTLW